MSHLASRFATAKITIWRTTYTKEGDQTYALVGSFDATYKDGQRTIRDNDGLEFVPRGMYYPVGVIDVKRGDVLARGVIDEANPVDFGHAERVRVVNTNPANHFNWAESFWFATE